MHVCLCYWERETKKESLCHSERVDVFFDFQEGSMTIWQGLRGHGRKSFDADCRQKASTTHEQLFIFSSMFSLSSINAWAVLIRLLHSCVLTILLGNRTPSSLSYAVQINIKQWDITCRNATMSDEIMVFWCWCKLDLMGKGKSAESKKTQQQPVALSPRSTKAALPRLCSQLRQVEYGLIKERQSRNFIQFPQIRGYCFSNSWAFC